MRWRKKSTARARKLRRAQTSTERTLWKHLRRGALDGFKFRRQHPIGEYFADFACVDAQLVVELDGAGHDTAADAVRDERLSELGWKVLRVGNHDVVMNLDGVLQTIRALLGHPSP